jgi:hypothetical protein
LRAALCGREKVEIARMAVHAIDLTQQIDSQFYQQDKVSAAEEAAHRSQTAFVTEEAELWRRNRLGATMHLFTT